MSVQTSNPIAIAPEEVAVRRGDGDLFVLDVRNREDYEEWPLEHSHNLPIYDQLLDEDFSGLAEHTDELPDDREIAVVCVAGITSTRAATYLRERGFDARVMNDGMNGWGRLHRPYEVDGLDGVIQVVRPGTGCLSYLVHERGEGVVVDPSRYVDEYLELAGRKGLDLVGVVDTHVHADHISGGRSLAEVAGVPYYRHPDDAGDIDRFTPLFDGETLAVGERTIEVLSTPGHTSGSVSLRTDDAVLSGDTLFLRSVGRPDLHGEDQATVRSAAADLHESLQELTSLADDMLVFPAHLSDEERRPVVTSLYGVESNNELLGMDDRDAFVEAVTNDLGDAPPNDERIKAINQGATPETDDVGGLELGPNNCAAD